MNGINFEFSSIHALRGRPALRAVYRVKSDGNGSLYESTISP
jgi:hypothetical protein